MRKALAMGAYLLAALSGAIGQFCFKLFATQMATEAVGDLVLSPTLWIAIVAYFGVMVLFIIGLRLQDDLSTLYPIYGSTFVWAMAIAAIWLGEPLTVNGLVGAGLIIAGIALLGARSRTKGETR